MQGTSISAMQLCKLDLNAHDGEGDHGYQRAPLMQIVLKNFHRSASHTRAA